MTTEKAVDNDYRSRQKRTGDQLRQETRHRLLEAAAAEFAANGYAASTVTRIAEGAGVSVQTLYLAWGSKRALLRAYMERALAGIASSPAQDAERFTSDMPPEERLAELAALVTDIAGRAALGWTLYRDAAAIDPEIADDWNELQNLRHQRFARIVDEIPDEALAAGLCSATAIDTAWVLASPETFDLLTRRLGYTLDDFHAWLVRALTSSLLAASSTRSATPRDPAD